jgi:hypothetical protein
MNERPLAFRLPEPLVKQIDAYAARTAKSHGRLRPNRAEALRELVALGLATTAHDSPKRSGR